MRSLGVYRSTVVGNKSFRTTIRKPVVNALGLQHKDKILWDLIVENGDVFIIVRKEGAIIGAKRGAKKAYK